MLRSVSLPFVRRGRRGREDELEEYDSIVTMFSHLKSSVFNRDPNYEVYRDVDRTELCPEDSFFKVEMETGNAVNVVSPFLSSEISETIDTTVENFGYISTNRTFVTYGIDAKYLKIFGERDSPDSVSTQNIRLPRGQWLKPVYGYIDNKEYFAGINYDEKECKHYHISVYHNFKNYPTIDLKVRYAGQLSNMIEYAKHGRMTSKEQEKLIKKIEDFYKYQNEIRLYAALEYDSPIVGLANCPTTASLAFCNANNNCFVFEPKPLQINRKHYTDYTLKGIIDLSLPCTGIQICHRFVAIKNDLYTLVFKYVNKDINYSLSSRRSSRQRSDFKTNYSLVYEKEFKISPAFERRLEMRLQRPEQQALFEKIIMRPIFDHQNGIQAVMLFTWRHEEITCVLFQLSNLNWFPISRLLLPADIEIYDLDISLDKDMIHLLTPDGLLTYCTHVHEFLKLFYDLDHPTTLLNLFYSKTMPYKRMYLISVHEWDDSFDYVKIASSSSFFRFINSKGKIFQVNKPDRTDIDVCLSLKHAEFSHKSKFVRRFFYRRASEPAYSGVPTAHPMTDMFSGDMLPGGTLPPLNWMPSSLWISNYDPNLDEHYLSLAQGIMLTSDQLPLKDRKHIIYRYQECLDYFNSHFEI